TRLVTLRLTADGAEVIDLPGGKVRARRLRYEAPVPSLPAAKQKGVIYLGAHGEILRCDNALFGSPLKAKAPAKDDEGGLHISLHYVGAGDGTGTVLRAERNDTEFDLTLQVEEGEVLANATCDDHFRAQRIETSWRGRPFSASFDAGEVEFSLSAG